MDGAIVLSADFKKILFANAQLIPDSSVSTSETGTRHRTAERTARQTGSLVISISQRRGIITIFKGNICLKIIFSTFLFMYCGKNFLELSSASLA